MEDASTAYFQPGREGAEIDPSFPPVWTTKDEIPFVNLGKGIRFKPVFGRNILFNYVFFEPHSEAPMHAHAEEQIGTVLEGEYAGPLVPEEPLESEPLVVFAARMIPEKRAPAVVPAIALAARRVPGLRGIVFGDGPDRPAVLAAVRALGADAERVAAPGFAESAVVHDAMRRALCMILPSRREGYGMVVVEAAACGTPSILVCEPDNAATELIEDGVNGVIAASAAPADLAAAIVAVDQGGAALRASTRAWFAANAERLSLESSLRTVLASYGTPRVSR